MLQQKWLTKLMGFDYTISYKKGVENKVADALSRRGLDASELNALSMIQPGWLLDLQESWVGDEVAQQVITSIAGGREPPNSFSYTNHTIRFQGRLYVGSTGELRKKIMQELHQSGVGGPSGRHATLKRI